MRRSRATRGARSSRTRNPAGTSAAITRGASASPRSSDRNCSAANSVRSRQGSARAWAGPVRTHFTITVRAAPAPRAALARQPRAQDAPTARRRPVRGRDPSERLHRGAAVLSGAGITAEYSARPPVRQPAPQCGYTSPAPRSHAPTAHVRLALTDNTSHEAKRTPEGHAASTRIVRRKGRGCGGSWHGCNRRFADRCDLHSPSPQPTHSQPCRMPTGPSPAAKPTGESCCTPNTHAEPTTGRPRTPGRCEGFRGPSR